MAELLKYPIEVSALDSNEIAYEMGLRNLIQKGTLRQKAIELQKVLDAEQETPLMVAANEKEFNMAIDRLGDLQKELKAAMSVGDPNRERVAKSKIRHYQDRAFRAAGTSEEADTILYGMIRNIMRIIRMSLEERENASTLNDRSCEPHTSRTIPGEIGSLMMGRGRGRGNIPPSCTDKGPPGETKGSEYENLRSSNHMQPQTRRSAFPFNERMDEGDLTEMFDNWRFEEVPIGLRGTTIPVGDQGKQTDHMTRPKYIERRRVAMEKWPVRFSGDGSLSLTDFLRKVELYAEADDVSKRDVFRGFVKLLDGIALEWYEVNVSFLNTWDDLVTALISIEKLRLH